MSRVLASTPAVLKDGTLAPWLRDLLNLILRQVAVPTLDQVTDEGAITTNAMDVGELRSTDWVGSVAAGLGHVVEVGSNANGSYWKFAGGLMLCTHTVSADNVTGTSWAFPQTFAAAPKVFASASAGTQKSTGAGSITSSSATIYYNDATAANTDVMAVGSWS